jgi:aquaporin Z
VDSAKQYVAEFVGTLALVFFGVGSAIAGIVSGGVIVVALTFGLVLVALAYTLGPVSGAHVNPAVTLGALVSGRISLTDAVGYWVAQFVGATIGAFLLWVLTKWGDVRDQTGSLGANGWGGNVNLFGTAVVEILVTALLVFVVMVVTRRSENAGFAGLVIGITLAVTNLMAIPLDGASVNPARSFGPALFAGTHALAQLWAFIVFPLIGGLVGAALASASVGDGWRYKPQLSFKARTR